MSLRERAGGFAMPILMTMAELAEAVLLEDHPLYREGDARS
jgi:hypothetical protein